MARKESKAAKEQKMFELQERLADLRCEAMQIEDELMASTFSFCTNKGEEWTNLMTGYLELYPELLWQRPDTVHVSVDTECRDLLCCELSASELPNKLGARALHVIQKEDRLYWCITGRIDQQSIERLHELESGRSCHQTEK